MSTLERRARAPRVPSTVHDALIAARATITDKKDWCRGVSSVRRNGSIVGRCAVIALAHVVDGDVREAAAGVLDATAHRLFALDSIAFVNDRLGHAAVLAAYDSAIQATAP